MTEQGYMRRFKILHTAHEFRIFQGFIHTHVVYIGFIQVLNLIRYTGSPCEIKSPLKAQRHPFFRDRGTGSPRQTRQGEKRSVGRALNFISFLFCKQQYAPERKRQEAKYHPESENDSSARSRRPTESASSNVMGRHIFIVYSRIAMYAHMQSGPSAVVSPEYCQ